MKKGFTILETTIPSYLTSWPSRDLIIAAHQQVTREWWRRWKGKFDIYVSQLVVDEARAGDDEAVLEKVVSFVRERKLITEAQLYRS